MRNFKNKLGLILYHLLRIFFAYMAKFKVIKREY